MKRAGVFGGDVLPFHRLQKSLVCRFEIWRDPWATGIKTYSRSLPIRSTTLLKRSRSRQRTLSVMRRSRTRYQKATKPKKSKKAAKKIAKETTNKETTKKTVFVHASKF